MNPKLIFCIISPVSVPHDPSEVFLIYWFAAQETILIITNIEYNCACTIRDFFIIFFRGNCDKVYFLGYFDE